MLQQNIHSCVLSGLYLLGFILFTFGTTVSSSNQKEEYNYAIDVRPVERCPMNESEWQAAAEMRKCSGSQGYHCAPDKFHSKLIEFCYNKTRILVLKGNCLELAADGVLNYVKCHEFTKGCPDTHYFSNEIYKYPVCLTLAFQCFASDIKCLDQKFKEQQRQLKLPNSITIDRERKSPLEIILGIILFVFIVCSCVSTFFVMKYWKKIRKLQRLLKSQEDGPSDDLQVLEEVESELVFDDIYLSLLLRRHCRNGVLKNFKYLLEKRVMKKRDKKYDINFLKILTSRDKNGCSLLHCAAEGGSVDIFKALMEAMDEVNKHVEIMDKINIDDTTYDGRSVLHLACKNNNRSLCIYLLTDVEYTDLLLHKKSIQGWNAAHFAAAGGDLFIMDVLEKNNLDITVDTKNGLNILDIACIHSHTAMCESLMTRKDLNLPLTRSDARGWTLAHFAAMAGNSMIFDYLIEKNIDIVKTKNLKTILHICCEYGHEDLCKKILKSFDKIVYDKDDEDWNALHYAAKGGNLWVYKEIEKKLEGRLCEMTRDERTVLHIACINNRTNICKYICNKKSYESIINSKGEFRGWTAAHYVAVEERHDKTEENLIRILVKGGIDLQATTVDELTVLGVACEHRNRNLIDYLLENHRYLLGVETDALKAAAEASNDEYIVATITKAIERYDQTTVNVKVPEVKVEGKDITLAAKQGSEEDLVFISK